MADARGRKARATNDVYDEPNPELGSAREAAEAAAATQSATPKATDTPNNEKESE